MHAGKIHEVFSPSPLLLLSFASTQFLLLPLRRDMNFCFLVELLLLLLIISLVGCGAAAAGVCAAYNISTEAERGTGYYLFVSTLYSAMLRTSIAAVVLGCFYFCPLDCDASVMVVGCAAVETGCIVEK